MNEHSTGPAPGKALAITGEALYLLNLLFSLLPLLVLAWLYYRHRNHPAALARVHLRQTFIGACIASAIFLGANLLILVIAGTYHSMAALVTFEVYYMAAVPLLMIPGLLGLIKAMAGDLYHFPLIGRPGKPAEVS
ncbi:MAG TPA: hypothetical protein ENK50_04960 [Sedimenticola sp.]|nr:hypothetical protein [Sedimenticola sp.]